MLTCIDHVVVPVSDLEAAAAPYERLGLNLTPRMAHAGIGTENRVFMVGGGGSDFYLELLGIRDEAEVRAAGRAGYIVAKDKGIARVMLGVDGLAAAVANLQSHGIDTPMQPVSDSTGRKICDVAPLEGLGGLGFDGALIEYADDRAAQHARREAAGRFKHDFPLKRIDHMATMIADLPVATKFWADVLGVPVFGEVRAPGMIIQQMKVGDAMMEFLAADGPDSRLAGRRPGLASMVAWEVQGRLDEAVALARERGLTPSEPANGVLPGTRVCTIPGTELAGVAMQLLEYV
jgi:catechol 2,3-dioxygenase-like lactoylglutathione lyase family enzyme